MTKIKTRTGHLLIGTEAKIAGEYVFKTYIVPATFTENGLAMSEEIDRSTGYAVTHVSSGLKLRGHLLKREARAMLFALADQDWTFHKNAVTIEHGDKARAAFEAATGRSAAQAA